MEIIELLVALGEILWGIVQLIGSVVEILSALSWIADVIAFIKSKTSRIARKVAKAIGAPLPNRSGSHIAYIVFTISSLMLTVLLLLKWFKII